MKKHQRHVYLELTKEIEWNLCAFCKYAEFSSLCDGDVNCKHDFWEISDQDYIYPGQDCWGFRPDMPISDIADIVGIIISHNWDPERTSFSRDKEIIEVYGVERSSQ